MFPVRPPLFSDPQHPEQEDVVLVHSDPLLPALGQHPTLAPVLLSSPVVSTHDVATPLVTLTRLLGPAHQAAGDQVIRAEHQRRLGQDDLKRGNVPRGQQTPLTILDQKVTIS